MRGARHLFVPFVVLALLAALGCGDGSECVDCTDGAVDSGASGDADGATVPDAPGGAPPDGSSDAPLDAVEIDAPIDAQVDAAPPGSFTIATWNIENFPKVTATAGYVQEIIERYRWDIVAVQEVDNDAVFMELIDSLEDYEGFVSFDVRAFTREAILYRRDRVRVTNVDRIFQTDQYAFPRDPLVGDLEFLGPDGDVRFDARIVVLHLKAIDDLESQRRRRDAIVKLDQWVRDTIAAGGDPDVILAGDYNDELGEPASDNVFAPFTDGGYRILTESLEPGSYSFVPFRSLLDHIVVSPDALTEFGSSSIEVTDLRPEILNYVRNVSDHMPVVTRFAP